MYSINVGCKRAKSTKELTYVLVSWLYVRLGCVCTRHNVCKLSLLHQGGQRGGGRRPGGRAQEPDDTMFILMSVEMKTRLDVQ